MSRIHRHPQLEVTSFHGMVTGSPRMLQFFELLRRVGQTDSTVLVRGETGTGKELVAAALHAMSRRSEAAYRAVNCALLTGELLASELFGHVRGAFTGAVRDRVGLFALADGGTVFLDEVAEMPSEVQARLLRVLEHSSFVPLGGTDPLTVDVRLIAATNKPLRRLVEEGRFREDLMYRIRVVPLFLPRLAERDADVEVLAWHFIEQFNRQHGRRHIDGIADRARDALLAYPWPGNVRELRNALEYAYAVGEGPVLTEHDLTPELRGEPPPSADKQRTADEEERERILAALRQARGRKAEAAELLGMSRTTLWRRMRELQL